MGLSGPEAVARGADDPYAAFCLDEACMLWGRAVEETMESESANSDSPSFKANARQRAFMRMMGQSEETTNSASGERKFKDPSALFNKGS